MPIFLSNIPYLTTQNKHVSLTPYDDVNKRNGFGNLVFLFSPNISESIKIINNKNNCIHNGRYSRYYYTLTYRGTIAGRRYNIKDANERKSIYKIISDNTPLTPHPPSLLNKTQNRNTYFEMCKYYDIYKFMTKKMSSNKKIKVFWNYFNSIWSSDITNGFINKYVLINADLYGEFNGTLTNKLDNPLFTLYYSLYKRFDLIKNINIDFVIYTGSHILKVNPSMCDEKSYLIFKRELSRILSKSKSINLLDEKKIDTESQEELIKDTLKEKYNFVGNDEDISEVTDLKEKKKVNKDKKTEDMLTKKIDKQINDSKKMVDELVPGADKSSKEIAGFIKTQSEMSLDEDKELIESMYNVMKATKVPTKPLSSARDAQMRKRQEELKVGNLTINDLQKMKAGKKEVPKKDVSHVMHTINENVKQIKYSNINKEYIDNIFHSDIIKTFTSLNNKEMKLFIRDVKIEETSDELNYKETFRIVLEDERKQRHTVTVDIPKFLDHKFMYLGGNKKIINKQNFLYPVVKTAPDTVQIVTNYNKVFIRRTGAKTISQVERISKLIGSNESAYKYFTVGDSSGINKAFLTTIEYDQFSKIINKFNTSSCTILFNQSEAVTYSEEHKITIPENKIFIGMRDKHPIFLDGDTQLTEDNQTIADIIFDELPEELRIQFSKTRSTKKLMYSTATVMSQTIPFIILLLYWEGISSVFKKIGLKYYFSSRYPDSLNPNEAVIRFKDGYFVYEENLQISLLLNGMRFLDTENYNMNDYNTSEPFIEYFRKVYGKVSILNVISNYYEFLLDPITLEVLDDINLPTDLIELCIYANNLLADESFTIENSQKLSRIRSTEIIAGMLYGQISRAYLEYKNSSGKKKVSIPRDCVIKELLGLQTVEDYSTLNPIVELEKDRAITSKGFKGINVDRAYSQQKRSYDSSMIGVMATSTSPDGNCGINRFLTLEPTITSERGYLDLKEDRKDELKDVNLFSPAELLYPLGNTRDDGIRTAMAVKQSKHVIPVKNASSALITNGVDEAIRFHLSSDFVINADEDGTVIDYDDKSKVLMVQYKSGKCRAIDLSSSIVKNGGGGFYLNNELVCSLSVGDKFKKDEPLAWHKDFFQYDSINGLRMKVGSLEKVAIMSSYNTYNDSSVITNKLAEDAQTNMTFCKSTVLGKNSNVYDMRKIGDHVSIGDSLISFDISFDDADLNKLLSHLSDQNKEVLEEGSINQIKSMYTGKIVDIKIYSTVDIPELSESLQKIVRDHYKRINRKKAFVSKYDNSKSIVKCGILLNETTGKIEPNIYGVIKGQKVKDSVLIEFYIEHGDILGIGDKIAYFTALKGTIGEVIPKGYEPYSEFRPEEEISSLVSPSAIIKRQVPSIVPTILGNKVIVELKRKLEEIYNS